MNVAEEVPNAPPQETRPPSMFANLAGVIEDHVHLATLEATYEIEDARRRLVVMGFALLLGTVAFLLLQVAIVDGLVALLKWPIWAVCLILTVLYGSIAVYIFKIHGQRDLKAGAPFSGTRHELIESLQWIQKLFS